MNWQTLITSFNVLVALAIWVPSAVRIIRRRSSSDYHVLTFVLVGWLQLSNCAIAWANGNMVHVYWFALNGLLVSAMGILVWSFRNGRLHRPAGF